MNFKFLKLCFFLRLVWVIIMFAGQLQFVFITCTAWINMALQLYYLLSLSLRCHPGQTWTPSHLHEAQNYVHFIRYQYYLHLFVENNNITHRCRAKPIVRLTSTVCIQNLKHIKSDSCPGWHCHKHTHTGVYLDSILHTPSCCHKYSLQHQMWIPKFGCKTYIKQNVIICLFDIYSIKKQDKDNISHVL